MELVGSSFLLIGLLIFGDVGSIIADQLRRPKPRIFRFVEDGHEPPPAKRAPVYSAAMITEPACA